VRKVDPANCRVWAGNTREFDPARNARIAELEALIEVHGQLVAAVGRMAPDGAVEIIDGARRLTAILNLRKRGVDIELMVDLRELDEREAFLVSTGANEGREAFTATERARSYRFMLDSGAYESKAELADALGLDKSNVSRTMDVLELPSILTSKIIDAHMISARQASRFMSAWRESELRLRLEPSIMKLEPGTAARIFKLLEQVVNPPAQLPDRIKTEDGAECGYLKPRPDGTLIVTLLPSAGQVEIKSIIIAIGQALKAIRNQQ